MNYEARALEIALTLLRTPRAGGADRDSACEGVAAPTVALPKERLAGLSPTPAHDPADSYCRCASCAEIVGTHMGVPISRAEATRISSDGP